MDEYANTPILFKEENLQVLLAICLFIADEIGEDLSPKTTLMVVDLLEELFYKGNRKKKTGNPWGRRGRPKEE